MYHQSQSLDHIQHLLFFLFYCYLIYIQLQCFRIQLGVINIFLYSILTSTCLPNMTIHLDTSMLFVCFYNGLTSSMTSTVNSFISDFISSGKSYMNIKNNKVHCTDPWGRSECIFCFRIRVNNFYTHGSICQKISYKISSSSHLVVPSARISQILFRHPSLSFIVSGRFSGYTPYPHRAAVCRFELVALFTFLLNS